MKRFDIIWDMLPKLVLYIGSTGCLAIGAAAQLLVAVILARYLGVEQFARLLTMTAATSVGAQLCGLGSGDVMIRRIARDQALYPVILGHSVILILLSGVVLVPIITATLYSLVRISGDPFEDLVVLFVFTLANVMLFRWITTTEQIFLARSQFWRANAVQLGFALARIVTVIAACLVFKIERLEVWILWYGMMHLIAAIVCVAAVHQYGAPRWCVLREEVKLGFHQTTPQFFDALQQNIDILVLHLVAAPAIVSSYGIASRIMRQSLVMLASFNRLLYPKIASAGQHGILAVIQLVRKYSRHVLALGAMTSISLFVVAPLAVGLFGEKFEDAIVYLRILCWLPLLIAIINVSYDAIGAADKHFIRANMYNVSCIVSAVLIAGLTYFYGIIGTFVAVYVSQVLVLVAMLATLLVLSRKALTFQQNN
jgi:O-antigen/teichoic acid export membrane protein